MSKYKNMSDDELIALKASLEGSISSSNNIQMALKILANALYGAISNVGFRYFELPMAEAITLTGQVSDKHAAYSVNKAVNKMVGTDDVDYLVACDTDSFYVNLDPLVQKFFPNKSIEETTAWIDKFCDGVIQPVINKSTDHIFTICNGYEKLMAAKREAIASKSLIIKKKRYAMMVHNSEGVEYKPYKLKIMGLDMVKSSTPKVIRAALKDCLKIMFEDGEAALQEHVTKVKDMFMREKPENIAFPRGVSDLNKWTEGVRDGELKSGTPIHVRASIMYNRFKDKSDPPIRNGDKIKFIYLKMPNPTKQDIIGFPVMGEMPMRDKLIKYIDWNLMFEKTFLAPLEGLTAACGWEHSKTASLEDFFS